MRDLSSWDLFSKGFLLAACLLGLWIPLVQGVTRNVSIVSIPESPAEGQNVTLSVANVQGDIRRVDWFRGTATDGSTRIFSYFPGQDRPQRNGVQHSGREFGFPNGSLLIAGVQPSDVKLYNVLILLRPKETLKGTIELQLARVASPPPATSSTQTPPMKEPTKPSLMLGWIVAGVVVGILLAAAVGAVMVYRFVLRKADPGTGMIGKLDPGVKKLSSPKHDDKEPIYEEMDVSMESPNTEGKQLPSFSGPLPPLPGTCPTLDTNYMELLRRAESIYAEIRR
ncbi:carcinoembryonic antigen-related cell adhesion molecule 19 [Rhineura floridana]|uniref:carcinoembryonic antigen-related cell adhesion molecule 19 n=1 Tax=Rhineura floridana TaxID=261503 RepID=UPI002AC8849A|nr:carcinoembryonic antigen-related cell adhesion molecule 19 [Rhineura floridana]XP_061452659.1 carcinoembryonic antigen-related cell adhesion molecule 19 [Rhineura floridana]XP_061452660.1 carcinoembryonic antigen-related cell adhesion molecule 19 [Rhineura floridana]